MITNWKRSLISCVAALAVAAFGVSQADAQHGGHGGHGGGHGHGGGGGHYGGGHYGGHGGGHYGGGHHSLGHLHLGYGGYGGYGDYGYYPAYGNGYYSSGTTYYAPPVVQNVVPSNVVPYSIQTNSSGMVASGGTIKIVNPSDSGGEVSYTLNGTQYSIKPGHAQTIQNDRLWTVAFGSGGTVGNVRYSLQPATYKFKVTDGGWNLFKAQEQTNVANNPLPPAPEPEPLNDEPRSVRVAIPQQ